MGLPITLPHLGRSARVTESNLFLSFGAEQAPMPGVHHVTGAWSYLIKTSSRNAADMEPFFGRLRTGFLVEASTILPCRLRFPGCLEMGMP